MAENVVVSMASLRGKGAEHRAQTIDMLRHRINLLLGGLERASERIIERSISPRNGRSLNRSHLIYPVQSSMDRIHWIVGRDRTRAKETTARAF